MSKKKQNFSLSLSLPNKGTFLTMEKIKELAGREPKSAFLLGNVFQSFPPLKEKNDYEKLLNDAIDQRQKLEEGEKTTEEYIWALKNKILPLVERILEINPILQKAREEKDSILCFLKNCAKTYIEEAVEIRAFLAKSYDFCALSKEEHVDHLKKAYIFLQKAAYLDEYNFGVYHLMGDILHDQERKEEALHCYKEAIKYIEQCYRFSSTTSFSDSHLDPEKLYIKQGYLYLMKGNYLATMTCFVKSIVYEKPSDTQNLAPEDDILYFFNISTSHIRERAREIIANYYITALEESHVLIYLYTLLILLDPSRLNEYGSCIKNIYDREENKEKCEKAYVNSIIELGRRKSYSIPFLEKKEQEETLALIDHALNFYPTFYTLHAVKGDYHMICKKYDNALACYEKVLEVFPQNTDENAIYYKGDIYIRKAKLVLYKGLLEEALEYLTLVTKGDFSLHSTTMLKECLYKLVESLNIRKEEIGKSETQKETSVRYHNVYEDLLNTYDLIIRLDMYRESSFRGNVFLEKAQLCFHQAIVFGEDTIENAKESLRRALHETNCMEHYVLIVHEALTIALYLNIQECYEKAKEICTFIIGHALFKDYSEKSDIYFCRGNSYLGLSRYVNAIRDYDQARQSGIKEEKYEELVKNLYFLVDMSRKNEKFDDAIMFTSFLIEITKESFESFIERGSMYLQMYSIERVKDGRGEIFLNKALCDFDKAYKAEKIAYVSLHHPENFQKDMEIVIQYSLKTKDAARVEIYKKRKEDFQKHIEDAKSENTSQMTAYKCDDQGEKKEPVSGSDPSSMKNIKEYYEENIRNNPRDPSYYLEYAAHPAMQRYPFHYIRYTMHGLWIALPIGTWDFEEKDIPVSMNYIIGNVNSIGNSVVNISKFKEIKGNLGKKLAEITEIKERFKVFEDLKKPTAKKDAMKLFKLGHIDSLKEKNKLKDHSLQDNMTLLMIATHFGHHQIMIKLLQENKENIDQEASSKSKITLTALQIAICNNDFKAIHILCAAGANVFAKDKILHMNAFEVALLCAKKGVYFMLKGFEESFREQVEEFLLYDNAGMLYDDNIGKLKDDIKNMRSIIISKNGKWCVNDVALCVKEIRNILQIFRKEPKEMKAITVFRDLVDSYESHTTLDKELKKSWGKTFYKDPSLTEERNEKSFVHKVENSRISKESHAR